MDITVKDFFRIIYDNYEHTSLTHKNIKLKLKRGGTDYIFHSFKSITNAKGERDLLVFIAREDMRSRFVVPSDKVYVDKRDGIKAAFSLRV